MVQTGSIAAKPKAERLNVHDDAISIPCGHAPYLSGWGNMARARNRAAKHGSLRGIIQNRHCLGKDLEPLLYCRDCSMQVPKLKSSPPYLYRYQSATSKTTIVTNLKMDHFPQGTSTAQLVPRENLHWVPTLQVTLHVTTGIYKGLEERRNSLDCADM